jgi:phage baseplate assembly protein W
MTIRNISFPFTKDSTSFPASAVDDEVVGQNIQRILLTPKGSRVMRRDQGSKILAFVFESTGQLLSSRMNTEVKEAIAAGEPRADVLRVETIERETASGGKEVLAEVTFRVNGRIRTTSVAFQ